MVRMGLSKDGVQVSVKISGDNFLDLKEVLHSNGFSYSDGEVGGLSKVWVSSLRYPEGVVSAIQQMKEIEPFAVPLFIEQKLQISRETEYFRIPLSEDCMRSSPVGEYQIRSIKSAMTQSRLLLALKQGLGKSFIVITALNHLHKAGLVDKICCVCRPEGVYNMKREFVRFSTFIREDDIYIADADHRDPFHSSASLVIMTYRCFLMLADDAYKKAHNGELSPRYTKSPLTDDIRQWSSSKSALILDESHSCANRTSRWTRAITLSVAPFRFRYLLTGTPYPHGIEGLWSQMNILDRSIIGKDYYAWLKDICYLGDRWSAYSITGYREDMVKMWMNKISPWIVREFTEDNIQLPEQIVKRSYFEMSLRQREIYNNYITYTLSGVREKNGSVDMKEVYNNFPAIQQALIDPGLLKGKLSEEENPKLYAMVEKWNIKDNNRVVMLDSLLDEYCNEQGKKVIIWSSHPYIIEMLRKHLEKYNPVAVHGEISVPRGMKKNEYVSSLVDKFKTDPKVKILIASILMLSTSQNIVEAPRAIYFDRTWSFTDLDQSIKRNHRIGTKEEVIVNFLLAEKSLDLRQDRVLDQRQLIDKDLLKYDSLSKDQWKSLFNGDDL